MAQKQKKKKAKKKKPKRVGVGAQPVANSLDQVLLDAARGLNIGLPLPGFQPPEPRSQQIPAPSEADLLQALAQIQQRGGQVQGVQQLQSPVLSQGEQLLSNPQTGAVFLRKADGSMVQVK
jgi:hypothetical protein